MSEDNTIDDYFTLLQEVYDFFGYREDWCTFPIVDHRDDHWDIIKMEKIEGSQDAYRGYVIIHDNLMRNEDVLKGLITAFPIYTQRFLNKWVYETERYTMILVDTRTDGNKYLAIFDNEKRQHIHENIKEVFKFMWLDGILNPDIAVQVLEMINDNENDNEILDRLGVKRK